MTPAPALPNWLDPELYPFRPKAFHTPEGRMSYVDEGQGPAVLLVHGTPNWSFTWREVVQDLALDHRVVAPDHLGFGLSDAAPPRHLGLGAHTRRLAALIEHLELRDLTLVVQGFGGPLGLPLALGGLGRVERVVVTNSWMWPLAHASWHFPLKRLLETPLGRWLHLDLGVQARWLLPWGFSRRGRLHRHVHRHYLAPQSARERRLGTLAMAHALVNGDRYFAALWDKREALTSMSLDLVWGMEDPWLGVTALECWRLAFPQALVHEVASCGHYVAEEAPEKLIRVIRGLEA
ncbi:MAG: alpha/beta fold hydrolase [Candidatus Sericytochromatia bacterium]|nr:alpha/beta fold hydrolase [Candidatus Sericytochromatia bacterium]